MERLTAITEAQNWLWARQSLEEASALGLRYPPVEKLLEGQAEELPAVHHSSAAHRKHMRSNDLMERLNREIRRGARVGRIFTDAEACLRAAGAPAIVTHAQDGENGPPNGRSNGR